MHVYHEKNNESYSLDQFRVDLHEFCNYIPLLSTITNTIAVIQKDLYVLDIDFDNKNSVYNSHYYKYLKAQDFEKDWLLFIPIANTIFCILKSCTPSENEKLADKAEKKNQYFEVLSSTDITIKSENIDLLDTLHEIFSDSSSEEIASTSDFNEHVSIYKNLMNSIIFEKESMTYEKKVKKEEILKNLAKQIIIVNGDKQFKSAIYKQIDELVTIKPGRILIKALSQSIKKIEIKSGEDEYKPSKNIIEINLEEKFYETLNRTSEYCIVRKPNYVLLAHELIHVLHHAIDSDEFNTTIKINKNILNEMDNLEEQHVITGFNARFLSGKNLLKKSGFLCENAFLAALGLPPRINHRNIGYKVYHEIKENPNFYKKPENFLFPWLENELNAIRKIPKDKDNEIILNFLIKNPDAISLNHDEIIEKPEIILSLIYEDVRMLDHFPDLTENKNFMLMAFHAHPWAYRYIGDELLADKDFIIQIFIGTDYQKKFSFHDLVVEEVFKKLSPFLQGDPEIRKFLCNKT